MTAYRRRLLSIALVLAMLISFVPVGLSLLSAKADDDVLLGKTTADKVNVRYGASTTAKLLFQIPNAGYVGTVRGEKYAENIHWYRVEFLHPDADNDRYYTGYVNAEFFTLLTEEEAANYKMGQTVSTPTPVPSVDPGTNTTPSPTPAPTSNENIEAEPGTIGTITNGGVNLRKGPSTSFGVITQLNRGDQVTVLTIPTVISDKTFYFVRYGDTEGFIMSTFLRVEGSGGTITPSPSEPTATPTPAPTPSGVLGYVMTIKGGVNLRQTPGGTIITTVKKYQTYPVLLQPIK